MVVENKSLNLNLDATKHRLSKQNQEILRIIPKNYYKYLKKSINATSTEMSLTKNFPSLFNSHLFFEFYKRFWIQSLKKATNAL